VVLSVWTVSRERRLARLARWLERFGVDLPQGLAQDDPQPLCDAFDRWTLQHWAAWAKGQGLDLVHRFRAAAWDPGDAALFTLALDTAMALGERLLRCRASLAWGIDRYEAHEADGIDSVGRIVVLDPVVPRGHPSPRVYSAEDKVLMRLLDCAFEVSVVEHFLAGMQPMLGAARE
jgi:hypothetical protein